MEASVFLPDYEENSKITHIDGNRLNNTPANEPRLFYWN